MRRLTRKLADSEQAALYASRHDWRRACQPRLVHDASSTSCWLVAQRAERVSRAVLLIDCDYFKSINDTLGHAAGDAVLRNLAERMKSLDRDRVAIAARLGGDEFALISAPLKAPADAAAASALSRRR